jgi:hypothetical protein
MKILYTDVKVILFILTLGFIFYFYNQIDVIGEPFKQIAPVVCPDPVYATDPNSNIVDTLLINDFMTYMNGRIDQMNSDLEAMTTILASTTFNIIIDPDLIPDVSANKVLPPPSIMMDSRNPPNYGLIFKLPKGRQGPVGLKGSDGTVGLIGPTGPRGPDGTIGKWLL